MAECTAESLLAAERARREAIVALDIDTLEAMTADWFYYAHISELVETRDEYFARMRVSGDEPTRIVATRSWDIDVEMRGGYALMTGKSHIDVTAMKFDTRFLAVWEPSDTGWKISAYASSPMPSG